MKCIQLLHLGIGNVGKELVRQILKQKKYIADRFNVEIQYCGMFSSRGGVFSKSGLSESVIRNFPQHTNSILPESVLFELDVPFIVIDTTASEKTFPLILKALKLGGFAVLSNKKPLASTQAKFDELHQYPQGRLRYETTVGAGLPIISTLKTLLATGDEILEITGCMSGTLGYILSELEKGVLFSQALQEAKEKGFTEPDPRDDLSGIDVARKALIISRLLGKKIEIGDIDLTGLVQQETDKRFQSALHRNKTLRFAARITPDVIRIGLVEVDIKSDLGALNGPDNIFILKTKRYFQRPLVIKGPGAGSEVTAAGVLGDILQIIT